MSIYLTKPNSGENRDGKLHRRIYEANFGPIPKEPSGRSYHIHHKDGNHDNNDPSNLQAVTAQEHYDLHYLQGDFVACLLIKTYHLDHTPEERSGLARKAALQRVEEGTHSWQTDEYRESQKNRMLEKSKEGTHPFLGGLIQSESAKTMVEDGRHAWVGPDLNLRRVDEGTHPSQIMIGCIYCKEEVNVAVFGLHHGDNCMSKPNQTRNPADAANKQIANGNHASQLKVSCVKCRKVVDSANFRRWHGDRCHG